MIKIDFGEPQTDNDWIKWRDKCRVETEDICSKFVNRLPFKIKSSIYRSDTIKSKFYLNDESKAPFYRKCCYCESPLHNEDGDIEHYRPKKAVTDIDGNVLDHPGYYWLAYDWKNLFPSCLRCNRRYIWNKSDQQSVKTGKKSMFPIKNESKRAKSHDQDHSEEIPLILNPLVDDPEHHLDLETPTGKLIGITERGKTTIMILGLNIRDNLVYGRKNITEQTLFRYNQFQIALVNEDAENMIKYAAELLYYIEGKLPYSFSTRKTLQKIRLDYKMFLIDNLKCRNLL